MSSIIAVLFQSSPLSRVLVGEGSGNRVRRKIDNWQLAIDNCKLKTNLFFDLQLDIVNCHLSISGLARTPGPSPGEPGEGRKIVNSPPASKPIRTHSSL